MGFDHCCTCAIPLTGGGGRHLRSCIFSLRLCGSKGFKCVSKNISSLHCEIGEWTGGKYTAPLLVLNENSVSHDAPLQAPSNKNGNKRSSCENKHQLTGVLDPTAVRVPSLAPSITFHMASRRIEKVNSCDLCCMCVLRVLRSGASFDAQVVKERC